MIHHVSYYAVDFDKSRAFYDAVLAPLGYRAVMELVSIWDPEWPNRRIVAYGDHRPVFWLLEVKEPHTPGHIAFKARTTDAVHAFYDAGLQHGGRDNGKPGQRPHYHPGYYGAFLLDPDGNNVEAITNTDVPSK